MTTPPVTESGFRLAATDIDGTLLRSDGSVSSATVDVLADLESAGIMVVFVTGRPVRWVRGLSSIVHRHGIVVCANGAIVYDLRRDRVLVAKTFAEPLLRTTVEDIRDHVPRASFALESVSAFAKEPAFGERHPMPDGSRVGPISDLIGPDVVKLLVRDASTPAGELLTAVTRAVGSTGHVTTSDGSGLVEISAPGVDKAATLDAFCDEREISSGRVIAFGDMPNDLEMLRWAGTSVAVANAHPDVLEAVDIVIASNDDDGVARVLRDVLEGRLVAAAAR